MEQDNPVRNARRFSAEEILGSEPTQQTPTPSSSRRFISRRDLFLILGGALGAGAIGGLAYLSRSEPQPNPQLAKPEPPPAASPESKPTPTAVPKPATASVVIAVASPTVQNSTTRVLIEEKDLIASEKVAWKKALGVEVEVQPLPAIANSEQVRSHLEEFGLKLAFLPKLDLKTVGVLKAQGASLYLDLLQARYPNWQIISSINQSNEAWRKAGGQRYMVEQYWNVTADGIIDFPNLPGQWIAVEILPQPKQGEKYEITSLSERLKLPDRFGGTWQKTNIILEKEGPRILAEIGLKEYAELRMLEAIEWNLLANREGWGKRNIWEWVRTEIRSPLGPDRIKMGHINYGGPSAHSYGSVYNGHTDVGFRFAIAFKS